MYRNEPPHFSNPYMNQVNSQARVPFNMQRNYNPPPMQPNNMGYNQGPRQNNMRYQGGYQARQNFGQNRAFPINTPRVAQAAPTGLGLAGLGKGLNMSKLLTGTQNMISTVTQAIPIYQQVKPLMSNSKVLTGAVKKFFGSGKSETSSTRKSHEVIHNPEVYEKGTKINKPAPQQTAQSSQDLREEKGPNRPFF